MAIIVLMLLDRKENHHLHGIEWEQMVMAKSLEKDVTLEFLYTPTTTGFLYFRDGQNPSLNAN